MFDGTGYYCWLITVVSGNRTGTFSGTMNWDGTRHEALLDRFDAACTLLGSDDDNTYTMCWYFEPNKL